MGTMILRVQQSKTAGDEARHICRNIYVKRNHRSVNQTLSLVATHKGSQNISCTPKQAFYFPEKRTMTIRVVTSGDSGGGGDTGSSPSLHKFDVVLIVLGCVGALILIAVIIAVTIRFWK